MKFFLRCPLVSLTALAVYLAVNIGAGVVHHHHGPDAPPGELPNTSVAGLQFQPADPGDDDGEEETCLLCKTLHLGQAPAAAIHVEAITLHTGTAVAATAVIRPHPLETATHSRAPPAA
jgi:hypothetical protein